MWLLNIEFDGQNPQRKDEERILHDAKYVDHSELINASIAIATVSQPFCLKSILQHCGIFVSRYWAVHNGHADQTKQHLCPSYGGLHH